MYCVFLKNLIETKIYKFYESYQYIIKILNKEMSKVTF